MLIVGWLALSLLLFLISSHFERISPPANVASALEPAGFPLTSPNNILVLGSDLREKGSKEPGASTSGPSRSDTIMLIRTGGGHSAKLSIPRDTVIDIPGHGMQKINAAASTAKHKAIVNLYYPGFAADNVDAWSDDALVDEMVFAVGARARDRAGAGAWRCPAMRAPASRSPPPAPQSGSCMPRRAVRRARRSARCSTAGRRRSRRARPRRRA